ncbi:DUF2147 domain-containing protein [Pelagibius sp. Alg239-R121]|uniref:DUF2147 domain-containing protein n=1 Tax=Pelagibius sp. Alg239-R121 TaxID=2993448 RepID=UPI0024A6BCE2|nr:DUF2147 domain-containing protein [Pelagibius sp. Alg239-R121]
MIQRLAAAILLALTPVAVEAAECASVYGVWSTWEDEPFDSPEQSRQEIFNCGEAVCSRFVWEARPLDEKTGKPRLDANHPDESKRGRLVSEANILSKFEPVADDRGCITEIYGGEIYDPREGDIYGDSWLSYTIELDGDDTLRFPNGIGWTRYKN